MATSQQPRRNSGADSEHHHVEQEIIKTASNHVEQEITKALPHAAANDHEDGALAAEKGQDEKKVETNGMAAAVPHVKRRFLAKLLNPVTENHPHIGFLHAHVPGMKIAPTAGGQGGKTSPSQRRKIAHSDPVRWKIKSQPVTLNEEHFHLHEVGTEAPAIPIEQELQAPQPPPILWRPPVHPQLTHADIAYPPGGGNSSELGVNAPNIFIAIHHVGPALTQAPAPASAISDMVVTLSSSSTDQLQNTRTAAGPVHLDPVVFEPGFIHWDEVKMDDEVYTRNSTIQLYSYLDMGEEII